MVMVWLTWRRKCLLEIDIRNVDLGCARRSPWPSMTFGGEWNAEPDMVAEREPPVPSPKNTLSVSPWMYSMSSG
jgi:hypothetical protein